MNENPNAIEDSIYSGLDKEHTEPIKLNAYEEQIKLFSNYFNNKNLSDLVIHVNKKRIYYAHQIILVTCSEVFNTMLCDPNWTHCNNNNNNNSTNQLSPQAESSMQANKPDCFKREIHLEEQEECEPVFEKYFSFFFKNY